MDGGNEPKNPFTVNEDIPFFGQNSSEEIQVQSGGQISMEEIQDEIGGQNVAMSDISREDSRTNLHQKLKGGDWLLSKCGKNSFPCLLFLSAIQFGIYQYKLCEDSSAVAEYFKGGDLNYCIVSASCLFIPTLMYTIYIVSIYVKHQEERQTKEIITKIVSGFLLIPWQIKKRVDVLHFSAQSICERRTLNPEDLEKMSSLKKQASILEFFAAYYSGFIQLLLQLYIYIISLEKNIDSKACKKSQIDPKFSEIIASIMVLLSMMGAIKRKDDGILTWSISIVGWLCIMSSRFIAIALAATVIHGWMILACLLHGALVSGCLTSVSCRSYKDNEASPKFLCKRKFASFCLIFAVFGLPSLTYWPIMFQLKKTKLLILFFSLLLLENIACGVQFWYVKRLGLTRQDCVLMWLMIVFLGLGMVFISMYICCKPKYTDKVAYHDMTNRKADSFGLYFEFCDQAFCVTQTEEFRVRLLKIRAGEQ